MKPVSPIVPRVDLVETVYAKDQPRYIPLPIFRDEDGYCLSRWKLSWRERLTILLHGDLYHWQGTFGAPLQPISMHVERPTMSSGSQKPGSGE